MNLQHTLRGHYQNAYVTHDIDKARAAIDARYGAIDWVAFETDMEFRTDKGMEKFRLRAALGWQGGLNIELIQPTGGRTQDYATFLPDDPEDWRPRFHHMAVRRDDLDAMKDEIAALGLPFAFEGELPGLMDFIYVDARESLGHYLEFLWATPEGWAMQKWPEGRAAQ